MRTTATPGYDALTALPNRRAFFEHAGAALPGQPSSDPRADAHRPRPLQGGQRHARPPRRRPAAAGDRRAPARGAARAATPSPRLGGDEFAVLLPTSPTTTRPLQVAETHPRRAASSRFESAGRQPSTSRPASASRCIPEHGNDVDALLQRADVAMYPAKDAHARLRALRRRARRAQPGSARARRRAAPRASSSGELVLHYQPKAVAGRRRRIARRRGAGALAAPRARPARPRRVHPARRAHRPDPQLTRVRARRGAAASCAPVARRRAATSIVAVNLSARDLLDASICRTTSRELLADHGVPAVAARAGGHRERDHGRPARARATSCCALRELGVGSSIDDFGTGYSSLGLPASSCRSTRSRSTGRSSRHGRTTRATRVIVRSTIDLAHSLGLPVVAEGVETAAIWNALRRAGLRLRAGLLPVQADAARRSSARGWASPAPAPSPSSFRRRGVGFPPARARRARAPWTETPACARGAGCRTPRRAGRTRRRRPRP